MASEVEPALSGGILYEKERFLGVEKVTEEA